MKTKSTMIPARPKPVRPKSAATLVILDPGTGAAGQTRVLMGRRAPKHDFLPNVFVFPGGRVEKTDWPNWKNHAPGPRHRLDPGVERKIGGRSGRAHALATAAIRETFEETGLALLDPVSVGATVILPEPPKPGERQAGTWPGPALAPRFPALDYIGRAITPPSSPKRFDTHFFVAHAAETEGRLRSNGELLDLDWYLLADALKLPLIDVTRFMLDHVSDQVRAGAPIGPGFSPTARFYSWRSNGWSVR